MTPSESLKFSRPLWAHQRAEVDAFAGKSERALLWDMGTGKTGAAIARLRYELETLTGVGKTLILSPPATLYNWEREFKIQDPHFPYKIGVVAGSTWQKKLKVLDANPDIMITNYESLDSDRVYEALKKIPFRRIICDEAQKIKNPKGKRFKKLLDISDRAHWRMILTGTPIQNSYMDLWSQYRFLTKGKTLGMNYFTFRNTYFIDKNAGMMQNHFPNFVPRPGAAEKLSALIGAVSSRLTKAECLDLPLRIYQTINVEMSAEQAQAYAAMKEELIAYVKEEACVATNALTRVLRMLQIVSGHMVLEGAPDERGVTETRTKAFQDTPREALLFELLSDLCVNNKVIVWCTFRENYRTVATICERLQLGYATLTGDTKDRQGEIDRFAQDDSCRVMLANPQAGGVGVGMQAASYAIYFSRSYNYGDREQSEARNHRGGSEIHEKITYIDLVTPGTIEEDVLSALQRKENYSDSVLQRLQKALA